MSQLKNVLISALVAWLMREEIWVPQRTMFAMFLLDILAFGICFLVLAAVDEYIREIRRERRRKDRAARQKRNNLAAVQDEQEEFMRWRIPQKEKSVKQRFVYIDRDGKTYKKEGKGQ
ncbi:MAG: hypothetical protein PHQ72_14185 [Hespellia sp.]|nr:hypothetical protein [Hespellia sp.]